jgi:hypothetical protein
MEIQWLTAFRQFTVDLRLLARADLDQCAMGRMAALFWHMQRGMSEGKPFASV